MREKSELRAQVGDTTKIPWNGLLKLPELKPLDSVKTDTAAGIHLRMCIERLAMRHFGFPVPHTLEDLSKRAMGCGRDYFTREWGKENQRDIHWVQEVSYLLLVSLLANSESESVFVADWMTEDRQYFPPGPPLDDSYCFLLYRVANEFRTKPKLDEQARQRMLEESKSKQVQWLWDAVQSLRENKQTEFISQISNHLKLYGSAVRKREAKPKLFQIEHAVSIYGSMVWAMARRKWPELEELPVTHCAFLLTHESVA